MRVQCLGACARPAADAPTIVQMDVFDPLPAPRPIQCAWCPHLRGESAQARILPWLAGALGQPPQALGLTRDARGRPYLGGMPHMDVNWSHSGDRLLVAFARGVRLGVDLEFQRPHRDPLALADRFFAPAETAQLRALDDSARETAFTRLWCAKEAVLKAHGQGISYGLDRLEFTLAGDIWQLTRCEGELAPAQAWSVHAFSPHPGYFAALAWRTG